MTVEVIAWGYVEDYKTVTEGIAVASITILQDADRISQAATTLELTLQIVVGLSQIVAQLSEFIESIGRQEWSFGQSDETWRSDDTAQRIGGCTVIAQGAVHITIRGIETHIQLLADGDVGIQSHVEARVVVLLQRAVAQ